MGRVTFLGRGYWKVKGFGDTEDTRLGDDDREPYFIRTYRCEKAEIRVWTWFGWRASWRAEGYECRTLVNIQPNHRDPDPRQALEELEALVRESLQGLGVSV